MTWQNDMVQGFQETVQVSKELNRGRQEMNRNIDSLTGWADRVMKRFNIDPYADYPKRPKSGTF